MNKNNFPLWNGSLLPLNQNSKNDDFIDLQKIWLIVRRQMYVVLLCMFVGALLGLAFLRSSPASYFSAAQILVDQNLNKVVGSVSSASVNSLSSVIESDAQMLSSIEVLRSMRLALVVLDRENLLQDPAFMNPPTPVVAKLLGPVLRLVSYIKGPPNNASAGAPDDADGKQQRVVATPQSVEAIRRELAANALRQDLRVERVGRSLVLNIGYVSNDPNLSYRIVNAYADAFLQDQQLANISASQQGTDWMKNRLDELAKQSREAALAVETFRTDNDLPVARGELVSDQRLAELNGQLVLAQSEVAQAQARSQQMDAIIASGQDAAVQNAVSASSDVQSPRTAELRDQYLEQTRRMNEIAARWGADHPQAVSLKRESTNTATRLFAELRQIAAQYRSEYAVSLNRQKALSDQTLVATDVSAVSKQHAVQLRSLEQQAQAVNSLYSSSLSVYEQAIQQQSFPVSNLRVISSANFPLKPSGPRFIPIIGGFMILGLMAGCGIGALREFGERHFRLGGDIRDVLGVKFLGYLPVLRRRRHLPTNSSLYASVENPHSPFTESLRNVRLNVDAYLPSSSSKVLGIVSILPGEGKTTVAANLANLLTKSKAKVILIDADLRRPQLSKLLAAQAQTGLVDVLDGHPWRDVVVHDQRTGLTIMPNGTNARVAHGADTFSSDAMAAFLQELRQTFDYIIMDLPPLGPVVDAVAAQPLIDAFLLVLRWGSTPVELTRSTLEAEPAVMQKLIGSVLTQVDPKALERYGTAGSDARAHKRYKSYFREAS